MIAFATGALADGWLSARASLAEIAGRAGNTPTSVSRPVVRAGAKSDGRRSGGSSNRFLPSSYEAALGALRTKALRSPIDGTDPRSWKGSFDEKRGERRHHAVDILAPRGTPVLAVDDGVIARRMTTRGGGLSVYQADASGRFVYSYLHLDGYADADEGDRVEAGDVIGYVGTTGNAPPRVPHLHFAISVIDQGDHPSGGTPIDPYLVFQKH